MQRSPLLFLSFLLSISLISTPFAQHEGHGGHVMPDGTVMSDSEMEGMAHDDILGEPMGSGTSWLPAGSPAHAHAVHTMIGPWMLMTHGELVLRYTGQNLNNADRWPPATTGANPGTAGTSLNPEGERGGTRFDAPNWAMVSAERPLGPGRLMLRAMASLDPATIGREGYPLLFQTGEGLVDRQHAHDVMMELGALYMLPLGEQQRVFVYAGLPGEPAVGPSAFMHRPSAGGNPDAPLGHHFQDATHITYGVATAGWIYRRFKAEGSLFRGQEPDADRWDIETGALDSWSVRLTQNWRHLSLQGSVAQIHGHAEVDTGSGAHGHGDVTRWTASLSRHRALTTKRGRSLEWSKALVYGMNAPHEGKALHSVLSETSLSGSRGSVWSRWEALQRTGAELDLPTADAGGTYWLGAVTLGAGATVLRKGGLDFFLGAQGAVSLMGETLEGYYGTTPLSAQVFVKVRPE